MQLVFVGVKHLHVLKGIVSSQHEVDVPCGEEVEDAGLKIEVLHRQLFPALGCGRFIREGLGGGRQAGPLPTSTTLCGLSRADGLEVNLLVERTTAEAQVEALTVPVLHSINHLLRHAHSEGEVPAHLPHHDGGANVFCLDFDVLARYLFSDLQAVGSVLVPTIPGAVSKGSGELVHLCLVHFLVHTLLEALEDDGELWVRKEKNRVTTSNDHLRAYSHQQKWHGR